ncbi:hypothetical protein C3L33_13465, partial [Rhododendron williamsianum]
MENSQPSPNPNSEKFPIPVDSEHKATVFRPFSAPAPHMRAFHLAWFSFFCCFVSSFAAPPLLPVIRDNLNLTATDIGNSGIAAVSGAMFARIVMGTACDLFGPRLASASLILATAPVVFCTAMVNSAVSFLLVRFFTVLTQVIFFRGSRFKTETGITLMGVMILCCALPTALISFPQWGGMFCGPSLKGATEEDYYMSEWSSGEKEKGFHQASLKFADNSRRERGRRVESAPSSSDGTPSARV